MGCRDVIQLHAKKKSQTIGADIPEDLLDMDCNDIKTLNLSPLDKKKFKGMLSNIKADQIMHASIEPPISVYVAPSKV